MLDPTLVRTYEVQVGEDPENFVPVHWESLEVGDQVRQYDPGSHMYEEYYVAEQPHIRVEPMGYDVRLFSVASFDDPEVREAANALVTWWIAIERESGSVPLEDERPCLSAFPLGGAPRTVVTIGQMRAIVKSLSALKRPDSKEQDANT